MDMYEAKQNKEKVSRKIDSGSGARQRICLKDNYCMNMAHQSVNDELQVPTFESRIFQAKWINSENILKWDQIEDEVLWYIDPLDNSVWLETTNPKYLQWNKQKKSWIEWNNLNPNTNVDINTLLAEGMNYLKEQRKDITWGNPTIINKTGRMENQKPYRQWLNGKIDIPNKMNCWESVLYAAYIIGLVDKKYIKNAITFQAKHTTYNFIEKIISTKTGEYRKDEEAKLPQNIPQGYVVIFGEKGEHVALSKGENLEGSAVVYELDSKTNSIEESTLLKITNRNSSYAKIITWGPFPVNPTLQEGESISVPAEM